MNQSAGAWDVHDQIEQELKRLQKDIDATNSTYQSICKNLLRSYTNAMHQYVQPTVYLQPICPTYVCVPEGHCLRQRKHKKSSLWQRNYRIRSLPLHLNRLRRVLLLTSIKVVVKNSKDSKRKLRFP